MIILNFLQIVLLDMLISRLALQPVIRAGPDVDRESGNYSGSHADGDETAPRWTVYGSER